MSEPRCSRCGAIMEDYGTHKLITGEVFLRDIVEGQEILPFQIHICPKCGKVEFTATEQTGTRLLSRKGLKKCVKCGKRIPLASEECSHCGAKQ